MWKNEPTPSFLWKNEPTPSFLDTEFPPSSFLRHRVASRAERIVAGQAVARERGARFGRPEGTGKRIKVTPEQEETIRRLQAEGKKIAAIAREVGLSRPTIYRVLERAAS